MPSSSMQSMAYDLTIKTVDKCFNVKLPIVIEYSDLLNDVAEITTPDIVQYFPQLQDIANIMPHYDPDLLIGLFIGRFCRNPRCAGLENRVLRYTVCSKASLWLGHHWRSLPRVN